MVYTSIKVLEKNSAPSLMKSNIIDTELQLNFGNYLVKYIEILDLQGKIIRHQQNQDYINSTNWASGIYLLRVLMVGGTYLQQKFLISH